MNTSDNTDVTTTTPFAAAALSPEDQHIFGISIHRVNAQGEVYWSAREVAMFLRYDAWSQFRTVVERMEHAHAQTGEATASHFRHTAGDEDVHLSRTGFLLVLQGADGMLPRVAAGKHYIAQQVIRSDAAEGKGRGER